VVVLLVEILLCGLADPVALPNLGEVSAHHEQKELGGGVKMCLPRYIYTYSGMSSSRCGQYDVSGSTSRRGYAVWCSSSDGRKGLRFGVSGSCTLTLLHN
jgi:hypothetical protein